MNTEMMLQGFEWYLENNGLHWVRLKEQATLFALLGVNQIWLPPAYKGHKGHNDSGYGVYDLYDLGEFNQKGSVATKYGTVHDYLELVETLKELGIEVFVDVVLNHRIGADHVEIFEAYKVNPMNRIDIQGKRTIKAWTGFDFVGRNNTYSSFKWNHSHFKAIDFDENKGEKGVYLFLDKQWDTHVDYEFGNYDYLMGADVDVNNPIVSEELKTWIEWYHGRIAFDGMRLDAVKHIDALALKEILSPLVDAKKIKIVGEYWSGDINVLESYISLSHTNMTLFDVPLHYAFHQFSKGLRSDLRAIAEGTLLNSHPDKAVTFVDNHDTQIGQSLESWVEPWFRNHAYAYILLRDSGTPCIFYTDVEDSFVQMMMNIRTHHRDGEFVENNDDPQIISWGFIGDDGFICILNIGESRVYKTNVTQNTNHVYQNVVTGEIVRVSESGELITNVEAKSVVILKKETNHDEGIL